MKWIIQLTLNDNHKYLLVSVSGYIKLFSTNELTHTLDVAHTMIYFRIGILLLLALNIFASKDASDDVDIDTLYHLVLVRFLDPCCVFFDFFKQLCSRYIAMVIGHQCLLIPWIRTMNPSGKWKKEASPRLVLVFVSI